MMWSSWLLAALLYSKLDASSAQKESYLSQGEVQHPFIATPDAIIVDGKPKKPNIVFILTDDQDLHMSSLEYMPHLQRYLVQEGTSFRNHYCTVALCCPSRVSLWTGRHAHNTNVTDINPPHGGYPKFIAQGFNDNYFPLWMQDAGYDTYYIGRLINAQSMVSYDKPHARGWNGSDLLLDPYAYEYLNATMQRSRQFGDNFSVHEAPQSYEGQYSTDLVANKSLDFLNEAIANHREDDGRPFFLTIAPTSPHSNVHINVDLSDGKGKYAGNTATQSPPVAANRHKHLFSDVVVPRTPDFNPDQPNSVSWLKTLPKQNQTNINSNDHFYRQRLRALQAVDEIIPRVVQMLEEAHILEETYIFYSSDNGYHIGQHRLQPGKQCAYETDINVPMIVRGPGIAKGQNTDLVTSHVDLAPTFMQLAGVDIEARKDELGLDGTSIPLQLLNEVDWAEYTGESERKGENQRTSVMSAGGSCGSRQEHINIEMWGIIMPEGKYNMFLYPNHTYKALRIIAADNSYNFLYTIWCTNERELYDLNADPYALLNLHPLPKNGNVETTNAGWSAKASVSVHDDGKDPDEYHSAHETVLYLPTANNKTLAVQSVHIPRLLTRLDALMMVLKTCKGRQCIDPWNELHPLPEAGVTSLREALDPAFDEFYERQVPRIRFEQCEQAYVLESEGPVWDPRDGLAGQS